MDCSREGAAVIPRLLSLAPLIACIAVNSDFTQMRIPVRRTQKYHWAGGLHEHE